MIKYKFISATKEYSSFEKFVPAPYLRKNFEIDYNSLSNDYANINNKI